MEYCKSGSSNSTSPAVYIYQLPDETLRELCNILDHDEEWRKLGTFMKYDQTELIMMQRCVCKGKSPTSVLLSKWGDLNHTVLELFVLLSRMKHYRAMEVIRHLVNEKYHVLIKANVQKLDSGLNHPCNLDSNRRRAHNEKSKLPIIQSTLESTPATSNQHNVLMEANIQEVDPEMESRVLPCQLPSIPYEELQESTNNWDENVVLGRGGFARVFKGTWKCTQVAIKRLELRANRPLSEQLRQSIVELQCLNSYRHDNILQLYGYSFGGPLPCLIYQYMAGGSMDKRLRTRDPQKVLDWPSRLNIAVGTARGLQFLHTINENAPLVHGDIKCANILLDANDNPRIGDFGLARIGPGNEQPYVMMSRIHGTKPYLPEEYLRSGKLSTKVDTHSFGVVLFELGTALAPYLAQRVDFLLSDYIVNYQGDYLDLKDNQVPGFDEYYLGVIEIGKMCVRARARDRPDMISVLQQLEKIIYK